MNWFRFRLDLAIKLSWWLLCWIIIILKEQSIIEIFLSIQCYRKKNENSSLSYYLIHFIFLNFFSVIYSLYQIKFKKLEPQYVPISVIWLKKKKQKDTHTHMCNLIYWHVDDNYECDNNNNQHVVDNSLNISNVTSMLLVMWW